MGGSYELYIDGTLINDAIRYSFNSKDLADSLVLRGCNNDKGGQEILFGAISVKRAGQTLDEYKELNDMDLAVTLASQQRLTSPSKASSRE